MATDPCKDPPRVYLLMGVAGCGKTTVGKALAKRLQARFIDADDLHPKANKTKMAAGIALDDTDRRPWLEAVAQEIDHALSEPTSTVLACSALKRAYRTILRTDRSGVQLVYLSADRTLIAKRLAARRHHFFPDTLLASQFKALEPPTDEQALVIPACLPTQRIVEILT